MHKLGLMGLVTVFLAAPAAAFGQACIGLPIGPGQFALGAEVQLPQDAQTYLGTFNANLTAPVAFRVAVGITTIDEVDENGKNAEVLGAYRLVDNGRVSACPAVGVRYMELSAEEDGLDATIKQTLVPVGLGVGTTLGTGPVGVTLYAFPHYLYVRGEFELDDGESSLDISGSSHEFGADLGVRIGSSRFFGGASVNITSIEDSDPVFSFGIGIGFGRRR